MTRCTAKSVGFLDGRYYQVGDIVLVDDKYLKDGELPLWLVEVGEVEDDPVLDPDDQSIDDAFEKHMENPVDDPTSDQRTGFEKKVVPLTKEEEESPDTENTIAHANESSLEGEKRSGEGGSDGAVSEDSQSGDSSVEKTL